MKVYLLGNNIVSAVVAAKSLKKAISLATKIYLANDLPLDEPIVLFNLPISFIDKKENYTELSGNIVSIEEFLQYEDSFYDDLDQEGFEDILVYTSYYIENKEAVLMMTYI